MSEDGAGSQRVSVSRDTLRAELAEMELRLRVFLEAQLAAKADKSDIAAIRLEVASLQAARAARDQGEFTPAQKAAIALAAQGALNSASERSWTWKERSLAILSALVTLATLFLSIVLALHGGL